MAAFEGKYSYRPGFNFKVPAQVVGETLERLSEGGGVTSQAFLDASRPEDSPTHALFEWNDAAAAEKYRLQQATQTINAVQVEIVSSSGEKVRQAAFVNVVERRTAKPGTFVQIEVALSNDQMREALLENALRDLNAFSKKYQQLTELAEVFAAIENVLAA